MSTIRIAHANIPADAYRPIPDHVLLHAHDEDTPRTAEGYAEALDQFDVGRHRRYQPRGGRTFCNIYVWDATRALGAEIPHWVDIATMEPAQMGANGAGETQANALILMLRARRWGWRPAGGGVAAQDAANAGTPTLVGWHNLRGIGHVAMLRPRTSGPQCVAQAGKVCGDAVPLAAAFGSAAAHVEWFVFAGR